MNNSNVLSTTIEDSWANTLSDYILQRRQQTKLAYTQSRPQNLVNDLSSAAHDYSQQASILLTLNHDDWLFKVIFMVLVKQLEEGHTVLTVECETESGDNTNTNQKNNDRVQTQRLKSVELKIGSVNGKCGQLYPWQQQLIESIAAPFYSIADSKRQQQSLSQHLSNANYDALHIQHDAIDNDIEDIEPKNVLTDTNDSALFSLLDAIFNYGDQFINQGGQAVLSGFDKSLLINQLEAIKQLYNLLQHLNNQTVAANNSHKADSNTTIFDLFVSIIRNNDLFTNANIKNSLSNNSKHNLDSHNQNSNKIDVNLHNLNELTEKNTPIVYAITQQNNITGHQNKIMTFWLHRTWHAEYSLAQNIHNILSYRIKPLDITIPDSLNEQQINAINIANHNALSIITGGPGTGKTYTVAQLVIALQQTQDSKNSNNSTNYNSTNDSIDKPIELSSDSISLALAAPTGKAAQRMQESLQAALDVADVKLQLQEAKTIHRLLGIGTNGRPRYHKENPLAEDVIIVDEASMLGVELASFLVSSIKPGARLILLGDANQLAAVDAGAVLADLYRIPSLQPIHATLSESRRFSKDSGIGKLAHLINQQQVDLPAIWKLLREDNDLSFSSVIANSTDRYSNASDPTHKQDLQQSTNKNNSLSKTKILNTLIQNYQSYLGIIELLLSNQTSTPQQSVKINDLMDSFNQFRILTAGHHGEWGDHHLNEYLTNWHKTQLKLPLGKSPWFHGRPVMVLQNNYELGLFNGDIGICLQTSRGLDVFFENKTQGIAVNLLNDDLVATAYAMTIHKSQGSEFNHVAITFDNSNSRLLSKELIYTAVTRAKSKVTVFSTKSAFEKAVITPTIIQTGLALQFEALKG